MKFKLGLILACLMLLVIFAVGCGEQSERVAVVNGENVEKAEFEDQVEQVKSMYKQQGMDLEAEENQEMLQNLEQQVLDEMINQRLFLQEADEEGIKVSQEEVQQEVDNIKSQFENEEQFKEALKTNNISLPELQEDISKQLKIDKYLQQEIPEEEINVTEKEIQDYYSGYKEQTEEPQELSEIEDQVVDMIRQSKIGNQRNELLEQLKEESEIQKFIGTNNEQQ